jgi:ABC-type transport system involved in cytochrome bd biosynthesis fused ATPase/permease subunit
MTKKHDEVNPACVERTSEAVAWGHTESARLEREILEMRHEREVQIACVNTSVAALGKDLALLTQNVAILVGDAKTRQERMDAQDKLIDASQDRLRIMEAWQIEETKRHEREEIEKKAAIARVEQERKERTKPWIQMAFDILEKLVWMGLVGAIAWLLVTK